MTGDDFRAWRKTLGLTQIRAAKALGISKTTIELYEAGRRRDTGASVEIPYAVALACTALFHGLPPWPQEVTKNDHGNRRA